jgi:hypothetical protein
MKASSPSAKALDDVAGLDVAVVDVEALSFPHLDHACGDLSHLVEPAGALGVLRFSATPWRNWSVIVWSVRMMRPSGPSIKDGSTSRRVGCFMVLYIDGRDLRRLKRPT